ncbi:Separin [Madurella mycetomatis]|uniref:separase n=1 Tax=Madurella mycetomatis TaxID=100816 RepID=A0A175WBV0_9PEZI|nr:Separin [Madurella mycetomatis]KXX81119.1 Separin [Madurella mycetomatis]
MDTPLAQADAVRSAVSSVATCSPATSALLKSLLLPKDDTSTSDNNHRTAPKAANPSRSRANTVARTASKRAKPAVAAAADNSLSVREKATLATHVVNATLKTLGEAAKPAPAVASPARRPAQEDDELVKTATNNALRRSSSVPMTPLQPRPLNRQTTSPIATRHARSPSKPANNTNLLSVVECARVALAALRQLPSTGKISLPEMQLESGMSALVGKLIALGLHEQAVKELRILKKRLEGLASSETKKQAKTASAESKNVAQIFSEILDFGGVKASGQSLVLVITTQIQALRILAATKKPTAIEAAVPHLRPELTSSPINLLIAAAGEKGADVGKIARQMETVAQCLLSLTPSVSSKDDILGQESRLSISPPAALELQALAFEARLHWWKLVKHKGDVEKDIMVPLSRCLGAYIRRSPESSKANYIACLDVFNRIHQQLRDQGLQPLGGSKLPLAGIYQTLVTLARDAQQFPDAVSWATKLREAVDTTTESIAKTCSLTAQLLSLHLKHPAKYLSDDQLLKEVVAGIQGPLRGDTAELDELLANVCGVRKAAMHLLLATATGGRDDNTFQPSPATKELLETFILQCPRFCLRWLGKPPGPKGSTKDYLRYEQRRQLMLQYLQHILDSAFMTIKTCLDQTRLSWDLMESILSDCTTLLEYTGNAASSDSSTSYFVKISHFYYLQYSCLRQQSTSPKDTTPLRALRRSVECVKNRPSAEKEKAQLTLKLERIAELCRTLGRGEEALGALQSIRASLLEDGVLTAVANSLATESPAVVWTGSEKAEALSRALLAVSKMEQVWVDWTVDLPEAERAAALEHRLRFILLKESGKQVDVTLEHPVVDALLRTYVPTRYPIRRFRVLLIVLCSAFGKLHKTSELLSVARDAAQLEDHGDLGEDTGLAGFLAHLKALYGSLAAAADAYRDTGALQRSIGTWRSIIETCQDNAKLEKAVDDVPGLLDYLRSVADFLRMKGQDNLLAAVLELMADIARVAKGPKGEDVVRHSSCLALQYTNLGQSSKAEQVFLTAQEYLGDQSRGDALARFHLAFAEHFVVLSNFRQAEGHLAQAQLAFANMPPQNLGRAEKRRLVANACYLYSVLSLERGDSHHALVYARESVRTLFQEWVKLESQLAPKPAAEKSQAADHTIDLSAVELKETERQDPGPEFWRLFYGLYRNIFWLSSVYAHLGMFQETMYYAEQALKMAETVGSEFYNAQCSAWIGSLSWKAAKAEKSVEMLQQAAALLPDDERSYASATLACQISSMYLSQNNLDGAEVLLAKAEAVVGNLIVAPAKAAFPDEAIATTVVENKMTKPNIAGKPGRGARKTTRQASAKKTAKAPAKTKATTTAVPKPVAPVEDAQLAKLRASILVQKAASMLSRKEWAEAQSVLAEATAASKASSLLPMRQVTMASCLLGMSMEQMAEDPVFSVIQDSTISFPALSGAEKTAPARSPVKSVSPRKARGTPPASQREMVNETTPRLYVEHLREAHDYLLEAHSVAALSGDASLIHKISGMLQNVGLFLTATSAKAKATIHSAQTSYSVELARNLTWRRERKALIQEKSAIKNDGTEWPPALNSVAARRSSLGFTLDLHKIQRDYIDIVPKAWNVLSISLSDGNHDLCITKLQAGQNPFVIRLPLERASSRDADSEVFDFQQGRAELLEIVKLINKTCHDSRDMSVKGAKSAWWAEREALDERLRELLENIEQIWLGGFRGIFSQHIRRPDLLARFQKDFLAILDKHLPSRRQVRGKKGKAAQGTRATLDMNILELFIGLGDATKPGCDFDDELNDLLYFVVDILQFHGERNAYDEIDFDSMVVETFDALQAYHSSVKRDDGENTGVHTILLLDKALHVFPWESLPCMQGLAVSRMPSLACLRRLILDQRQQSSERNPTDEERHASPEGHRASLARGTYILNPSGDLVSTQSTFSQPLEAHLPPSSSAPSLDGPPSWKRITSRPPTEAEFSTALTSSDILLYFGHGSGGQYIRSRAIRHLSPRCRATVLLMGCSSAALLEAGEFEPSGPVWNYLMAGSPAVVGTLWDVTDRDIDRFAAGCLEDWGLLPRGAVTKRERDRDGGEGRMSLVEAVASAKGGCKFRFVTGAGVVVYGVPVWVDRG